MDELPETDQPDVASGWEWMILEVMGHRRHAGRVREEERFGARFLRIDVPSNGDPDVHGWSTHFYPPSALFSFTPATREVCMRLNAPFASESRLAIESARDESDDEAL